MRAPASPPIRVLELRSVRGTGGGPEKTILAGAQLADPGMVETVVCYVRDRRDRDFALDRRARALQVPYIEVHESHSWDRTAWVTLRRLVRQRQVDIVHAHEYKTDALALWLSRVEPVLPLATAHGWTGHSVRERWLYYPADRWLLKRYPRVIAVSSDIKRTLVKAGCDEARVTVVLNGIDAHAFRRAALDAAALRRTLGLAPDAVVVGAVGRLEPQKRFDLLMQAVAALKATIPRLTLVIAGDGSLRRELAALAASLFRPDDCLLIGNQDDVARLHHAFDLFVQASDYEGTPNAVLEAMALETPVLATDAGGTAELVRDGVDGLVVPCGNARLLAAGIERILADPAASRARAVSARERVERTLSFESRVRTIERIYAELMEHRRGTARAAAVERA